MSILSLENRTVIVAGAAGGLGSVATAIFSAVGARLALLGHDQTKLDELAAERQLPPQRSLSIAVELGQPKEVDAAAASILKSFGSIDVLLNFVGGWIGGKGVFDTK